MKKLVLFSIFSFCLFHTPFAQCNNLTDGGIIGHDEYECGPFDPDPIINLQSPSGGSGTIEYMWIKTYDPNNYGMANAIPGATDITYDPPMIYQTTWYVRCARRAGCTEFVGESIVIKHVSELTVSMNVEHIGCGTSGGGQVSLNISGGVHPYTVQTDGNYTSNYISNLSAGMHYITVTDDVGCSWNDSVFIEVSDLYIDLTVYDDSCSSIDDYAVANVSGGSPPYNIWWSNGSSSTTLSSSNGLQGLYTVNVTDQAGCQQSQSVYFESFDNVSAELLCSQDSIICQGGSTDLQINFTGSGPWVLEWSDGNSHVDTVYQNPYFLPVSPTETTTYELVGLSSFCGEGNVCGKATIAVQDCDPSSCLNGCFWSNVIEMTYNSNGCITYKLYVSSNGCATDLSNLVISIPCGDVSNMSNSYGYPMYLQTNDPNTGLSGIKIDDMQSGVMQYSPMTVTFTLCPDLCGQMMDSDPIIGFKAGNCVIYDYVAPYGAISKVYWADTEINVRPNPFKDKCFISMVGGTVHEMYGPAEIFITDQMGKRIKTFKLDHIAPFGESFEWDGTDEQGQEVLRGIYLLYYTSRSGYDRPVTKIVKN